MGDKGRQIYYSIQAGLLFLVPLVFMTWAHIRIFKLLSIHEKTRSSLVSGADHEKQGLQPEQNNKDVSSRHSHFLCLLWSIHGNSRVEIFLRLQRNGNLEIVTDDDFHPSFCEPNHLLLLQPTVSLYFERLFLLLFQMR